MKQEDSRHNTGSVLRTPLGIVHEELSGPHAVQSGSWLTHEEREDEGAGLRDAQQDRALQAFPGNLQGFPVFGHVTCSDMFPQVVVLNFVSII